MKKLIYLFLLSLLTFGTSFQSHAQLFQWAQPQQGSIYGPSLASGYNFLVTTGLFRQTITVGNQTFTTPDSISSYLAAHDLSGNILWARHIVGRTNASFKVAVDPEQNIILTGTYVDSLFIGTLLFKATAPNSKAVFVAKFSNSGSLLWAKSATLSPVLQVAETAVSTDQAGNVYVAGCFSGTLTFGTTSLAAPGTTKAFLAKYDAMGNFLWAKNTGSATNEFDVTIINAHNGDVIMATETSTPVTFSSGIVVTRLSPAGTQIWTRSADLINSNLGLSITTDITDNIYVTGKFSGIVTFNNPAATINLSAGSGQKTFLAKMNGAGTWKWAKQMASGNYTAGPVRIFYSPGNDLAISGSFTGAAQFTNAPLPAGTSLQSSFIARFDTAGTAIWANNVPGYNFNTGLTTDANGNFYMTGLFYNNAVFSGTTLNTSYRAGYLTKVVNGGNELTGRVFLDANGNGIKDVGEMELQDLMVQSVPGPQYGISGPDGTYKMYLPDGSHAISISKIPLHHSVNPATRTVVFSGQNQNQTGQDFAIVPIPNAKDVAINITSFTRVRPGFNLTYRITFTNKGTVAVSDSISLMNNLPNLTFISATSPPVVTQNGMVKWVYQNLQPQETRQIDVNFQVPVSATLGTNLLTVASIQPISTDLIPKDNVDSLKQVVTGSYDPNDKQVDKPEISPAIAAVGEFLDYTIRFQNTGTDTAFTVIITDKISTKLNLGEFSMVAASHPYKLIILNNKILEWRFDNILLPDSNRNEPASHGFVRFRIKSKPGMVLGDSITNQASIFFDFNAPIITNHAVTKVANPTSVKDVKRDLQPFQLYPNPARNYVMVAAELKKPRAATVRLVNVLGQIISEVTLPANSQIHYQLPLQNLPKGVYLVQLETENGRQTQWLVVQ